MKYLNPSDLINKKPFFKSCLSKIYKYNNLIVKKSLKTNLPFSNEHNILKNINNKNIIKLLDYFEDENYNYIVLPYYPYGDLYYNIYNRRINTDNNNFLKDLVNPIEYLHNNNIVHLDLKLENYLVNYNENKDIELILFDFNLSHNHNINYYNFIDTNFIYGTSDFLSPEMKDYKFSKSSDIYSLGCMLYMLYSRTIYENDINFYLLKKNKTSDNIISLIKDCVNKDSLKRPTIFDIKHYYLT